MIKKTSKFDTFLTLFWTQKTSFFKPLKNVENKEKTLKNGQKSVKIYAQKRY